MASGLTGEFLRFDLSAYLDLGRNFYRLGGLKIIWLLLIQQFHQTASIDLFWNEQSILWIQAYKEKAPLTQKQMDKRIVKVRFSCKWVWTDAVKQASVAKNVALGVLSIFVLDKRHQGGTNSYKNAFPWRNNPEAAIQYVRDFGPKVLQRFEEQLECVIGFLLQKRNFYAKTCNVLPVIQRQKSWKQRIY